MEPKKIKPLPATRIEPSNEAKQRLRTIDMSYIMREKFENWKGKTIFRSRTIITVFFTIAAFVATKFLGLPDLDWKSVIDAADGLQVEELFALGGLVLAAFFRKNAKVDLDNNG